MRRLAAILALLPAVAGAEPPPDPRAEALNEDGKILYLERQDYAGAVAKFRAAIAIRPDARYSYNLCTALEKVGDLQAALAACDEVATQNPRPDLADKASRRGDEIRRLMPTPSATAPTPPGPPPNSDLYPQPPPSHPYGWALGVDLGTARNLNIGSTNTFNEAGGALRVRADIVVAPTLHLGIEPYLDLQSFTRPAKTTTDHALSIVNLGVAMTWHGRLWESLYFVPSAGLSFSSLVVGQPDTNDTYATIGFRADAGFEWVFGAGHHVLALVPAAFSFYPASMGQIGGRASDPQLYGLDKGGFTWTFFLGYRYRFSGSVINLE
jgi:hypothetical protein